MEILDGKKVSTALQETFVKRINKIKEEKKVIPYLAVLGIDGNDASKVYIKRIEKNCERFSIGFNLQIAKTEEEFIKNFNQVKKDKKITSIMVQEPVPRYLANLINDIPAIKDVEGVGIQNMGKLITGRKDALIPCTSKAVMETINYYNIDLTGKNVTIVGRSNIVGKPLIPQLLEKNATVTICHSKTKNLSEVLKRADVIVMAIGKPNFLKSDMIKSGAILIDVGINYENGKIVGDIDFENVKDKAKAITPVPGGIGTITNTLLIDNIIKSLEF